MQAVARRQDIAESMLIAYKRWISPLFGNGCRFSPTCAEYAAQAITQRGWWIGSVLALRRVFRCHPFASAGFDPVPSCSHCRRSHD